MLVIDKEMLDDGVIESVDEEVGVIESVPVGDWDGVTDDVLLAESEIEEVAL